MNTDSFGVAGRIKAFDQRNGGNPVAFNGWFYYLNGALRETEPLGALLDPPEDEYARLTNIVSYHKGRLAQAVRQFDACKESLMFSPYPQPESLDQLKQLQAVVGERNAAVQQATQNLAATEEGQRRERNRQFDAEQRQAQASFKDDVRAIRI